MDESRIEVNFSTRSFSVSGKESFVKEHYEKLFSFFEALPPAFQSMTLVAGNRPTLQEDAKPGIGDARAQYVEHGIFYIDEESGMPVIQASVPGESKREKMRNVALILLYAANNTPMSASYIKEQCIRQSCLDANNFSKAFEKDRINFIKKGKAGSREWTIELSIPGTTAAKKLLDDICSAM